MRLKVALVAPCVMKQQEWIAQRKKSAAYRHKLEELRTKLASLASIDEVLLDDRTQVFSSSQYQGNRLLAFAVSSTLLSI